MKRIITILLCVALVCSVFSVPVFAGDGEYWPAQKAYAAALKSNNATVIIEAVKRIEAAYPNPENANEYSRVAFPVEKAATLYEEQGDYENAVAYYNKFLRYVIWLDKNTDKDYSYYIKTLPQLIAHLSVEPEVYAATTNTKTVPYTGALHEPKLGTYFGTCNQYDVGEESAHLVYVQFPTENIKSYKHRIENIGDDAVIEIAWNLKKESLQGLKEVNSTAYDAYINANVDYLATLSGKVILRFGAEVDNWADNTKYPKEMVSEFKKAFRKIAGKVHAKAKNVAMCFSLTETSNLNINFADFYPGDSYVDWVGISSYQNLSSKAVSGVSSADAYYSRGHYEDMIVKMAPIVKAFGDKKPIMISECGFSYRDTSGVQTEKHAVQKVREFYSLANAVYPQIKLINYFDVNNLSVSGYSYALDGNVAVKNAYNESVSNNPALTGTLAGGKRMSYALVDKFSEKTSLLNLKIYASFPSHKKTTVTVKVDGAKKISASKGPYELTVNTKKWSVGVHTVSVTAKSGKTSRTVIKCLQKDSKGKITCIGSLRDVPASHWAFSYIDCCLQQKIFKGVSFETFEPDTVMTRAMFVQVLANISGVDLSKYTVSRFSDVRKKDWFCKPVMWASENKIVNGVGGGKFDPEASVTREQMCAMLSRYAKAMNVSLPKNSTATPFADQSKIGKWALQDVRACQRAGLINGEKKNGKYYFDPQGGATRSQSCKIFSIFNDF